VEILLVAELAKAQKIATKSLTEDNAQRKITKQYILKE